MHIKNLHCMIEKFTECAKHEVENGIEKLDTKEMGEVADIIKDLCEAEYYAKISKAMDESEYGEDYDMNGQIEERRYYRGQPRDSRGRYMRRRDYHEPTYHMTPEMYHEHTPEYYRDMDKEHGRMYYTEMPMNNKSEMTMNGHENGMMNSGRDYREGKSGQSRKSYMETKEMGKDKNEKMKELEKYMKELSEDLTELITDMSPEEKTMMKNKMQVLMQKI